MTYRDLLLTTFPVQRISRKQVRELQTLLGVMLLTWDRVPHG